MLAALCLARPIHLMPPADLGALPARIPLDWFYLFPHPAMAWLGADGLWAAVAAFVPGARRAALRDARAALARRAGEPRQLQRLRALLRRLPVRRGGDGGAHRFAPPSRQAQVDPDLCAGCGICTGACPSSTPFRRGEDLATGIDMPSSAIGALRSRLEARTAALAGGPRIVVFGCRWGAQALPLEDGSTAAIELPCGAMLPPSFVEYALRAGADGVLVAGCREGDCEFRVGDALTAARLAARRAPALRPSVPRERVRLVHAGRTDAAALRAHLESFRADLARLEPRAPRHAPLPKRQEKHHG